MPQGESSVLPGVSPGNQAILAQPASPEAVIVMLTVALERLTRRVTRDLDVDAGGGTLPEDPAWADTIRQLADYAADCAEVLDDPLLTAIMGRAAGYLPNSTWLALAGLDEATAATITVLADPGATPAQRIAAAGREEAALAVLLGCPGGLALLTAGTGAPPEGMGVHPKAAGLKRIRVSFHRPADGTGDLLASWDDGREDMVGVVTRTEARPGSAPGWRAALWSSHPSLEEGHETWRRRGADLGRSLTQSAKAIGPWWD